MSWLKDQMWYLNDIFEKFPSVFIISIITVSIAAFSPFVYMKALIAIANIQFFGTRPYLDLVANNWEVLKYGLVVIPISILLIGFELAYTRYDRLISRFRR